MTTHSIHAGLVTLLVSGTLLVPAFGQSTTVIEQGEINGPVLALPTGPGDPMGAGSVTNQWVRGEASLICSYLDLESKVALVANVQNAGQSGVFLFATMGFGARFAPNTATLLGWAPTDGSGDGSFSYDIPMVDFLPSNFEIEVHGLYADSVGRMLVTNPVSFLLNPVPVEALDFDWSPDSVANPAGLIVAEQWAPMGMHVTALNHTAGHPDLAILFNSTEPTGDDFDLITPGYGPMNDKPHGMLLIVPEDADDFDGDLLVDDPDDERAGGVIFFAFDDPVYLAHMTVIDIDLDELVQVRGFMGGVPVLDLPVFGIGDNSAMTIGFPYEQLDRLEVEFSGSGGIAEIGMIPCPATANFDHMTTGVPIAMLKGEWVTDQYLGSLGFQASAVTFRNGGTNKAILFDSENPSGGDFDLVTPGYHPTNTVAHKFVLILARNDVDLNLDGLVDNPNDDELGGVFIFEFDTDIVFHSATVLDVDEGEVSYFESYDQEGLLIGTTLLEELGDNSVQTVLTDLYGVRRIELHMGGSGALVDLVFCRDAGFTM